MIFCCFWSAGEGGFGSGTVEAEAFGGASGGEIGCEVACFLWLVPEVHGEEVIDLDFGEEYVGSACEVCAHACVDGEHHDVHVGVVLCDIVDDFLEVGLCGL